MVFRSLADVAIHQAVNYAHEMCIIPNVNNSRSVRVRARVPIFLWNGAGNGALFSPREILDTRFAFALAGTVNGQIINLLYTRRTITPAV